MATSSKVLRETDIKTRYSMPTAFLSSLPPFNGGHVDFQAVDESGSVWPFRCSVRRNGYLKPVISKGWRAFVHSKGLKVGDKVRFYKKKNEALLENEWANDLFGVEIELRRDTPETSPITEQANPDIEGQISECTERARLKSGWILLLTSIILEIASAVFDQLGYALAGMVLAFVALLLSTAELIYMERMSLLPIFHRTSIAPGKLAGTIVEYFGLVGGVWQCFHSTVAYAYARQKKDNPIKMCLLPLIFLSCVGISELIKNRVHLRECLGRVFS